MLRGASVGIGPGPVSNGERTDQLRLMTKVARLYHSGGLRQQEIAERLGVSQSRVSRLLAAAVEAGIVRTVVVTPDGIYAHLEDELERRFRLLDVRIVDLATAGESEIHRGLGAAAAGYLYEVQPAARTIGFTSWSRALREMVSALPPVRSATTQHVVELIGDIGSPATQHDTAQATQRFASLLGAEPAFIRAPGVVATKQLKEALLAQDPYLRRALGMLDHLDLAITGLGPVNVSQVLLGEGNFFSDIQLDEVTALGAVTQINLRYLDADGRPVVSSLDDLVIGVTLDQLRAAPRRLLVAAGQEKRVGIRAALVGGWVNMLITDLATAEHLLAT